MYRNKIGLTQKNLASKVGVTSVTIQNYENNRREPNLETLNKLAEALGVYVNDLIGDQIRMSGKNQDDRFKEVCIQAVRCYGEESRKQLAQEECAELIQALSKDVRGEKHNVEEEIADVLIMIEQLTHIYDNKKVKEWIKKKIDRLANMMEVINFSQKHGKF
ncbi:helix-turn-helix domain-containing protein [Clostridium sp. AWRP]|nr:helix-turn-helix domain-containing protein [Clostridium sp. AWRP]